MKTTHPYFTPLQQSTAELLASILPNGGNGFSLLSTVPDKGGFSIAYDSSLIDEQTLKSAIGAMQRHFVVYLPPACNARSRSYRGQSFNLRIVAK